MDELKWTLVLGKFFGSQWDIIEFHSNKNNISFLGWFFFEAINFVVLTEVRQEFLPNGKKSYRFSSQKGNFPYMGKGRVFDQNSMKNIISFFGQVFLEPINFVVLTEVRQKFLPNGKKSYRFSSQKGDFPYIEKGKFH
jgi:hypothetical protein